MTERLDRFKLIFWDFDGVIKESVSVKTDAFVELFEPYGKDVIDKVRRHHCLNCGVSRYTKIPLYLKWSKVEATDETIDEFCNKFSEIVTKKVIESPWVPGVEVLLRSKKDKKFILVSATPQKELEEICCALNLTHIFDKIFGSPANKSDVIKSVIDSSSIRNEKCLMIGDSLTDYNAAKDSNIRFLLLLHSDNVSLSEQLSVQTIENFL
jgi:phosphoglycolate phosphatase-like HAD superfamily hydrolase